tara:strand:- start:153 stop:332 length:180 start_codon:yes stop_codon:yes gene_type:complete
MPSQIGSPVLPIYRYSAYYSPEVAKYHRGKDINDIVDCNRKKAQRNKEMSKMIRRRPLG